MLTNLDMPASQHATDDTASRARKARRSARPDTPFLTLPLRPTWAQRAYAPVRRALDVVLTLLITLVAAPLVALAALAVKISSRGPAFYTQVRVGLGGRRFTILKIRTMIHNCESLTGPRWTIPGDPRVTRLGWFLRRTHLDELPQLLNVLRGDMSLIGPRPERPEFVAELDQMIPGYQTRHQVRPGITGLAQIQLPPDTDVASVRRKLVYDLYAIQRGSILLDARLFVGTALHMLGASFEMLARLRIIPGPRQVEARSDLPEVLTLATARGQRQAA